MHKDGKESDMDPHDFDLSLNNRRRKLPALKKNESFMKKSFRNL